MPIFWNTNLWWSYQSTQATGGLRHILIPISKFQWWDLHVYLLLVIPHMTILKHVDTLLFQMNMIGFHKNVYSRYLWFSRSKGATCSTSGWSIKWLVKHPVLHLSHISRIICPPILDEWVVVRGIRAKIIHSWVVAFNVSFSFYKPIPHFLANSSGVTEWRLSFVIVAYPFLVIETLLFPIILSTVRSWSNPI